MVLLKARSGAAVPVLPATTVVVPVPVIAPVPVTVALRSGAPGSALFSTVTVTLVVPPVMMVVSVGVTVMVPISA